MPWIGIRDGEKVIPEQVEDQVDIICPKCRQRMRTRGPMNDGRARHFFHIGNIGKGGGGSGGCEGGGEGESDVHRKYKSLAVSRLKELYPEFIASCKPEQRLSKILGDEFVELPSGNIDRQADAMMLLKEPTATFGRGLIVEVQYRNEGKDIEAATEDYLANGFSVLWADIDDFSSDRCLLTKNQIRQRRLAPWPKGIPGPSSWGSNYPLPGRHLILEAISDNPEDTTVPATLHLERWGRELDEIPQHQLWGVPAVKAKWGFGRTKIVPNPPHFDPPIHQSPHRRPNSRSRDVGVPAHIPAEWVFTDESDSSYAASLRSKIYDSYNSGKQRFARLAARKENQREYQCDACGNVTRVQPGLHKAPFKKVYCEKCGQTRMHVKLELIDTG